MLAICLSQSITSLFEQVFPIEDFPQLVANWLHSGHIPINYVILQINLHRAVTALLFLEEFLNFSFRSARFWLISVENRHS